jgi:hypothetical protein
MRKGVEISITFAVILIMTILVLGLSLIFLRNVFTGANEIQQGLERQTEAEIEKLIEEEGALVAIPFSSATLEFGERKLFGIGIRNVLPQKQHLQVTVQYATALINGELRTGDAKELQERWVGALARQVVEVDKRDHVATKVYLKAPSGISRGLYYFNVCVTLVPDSDVDEGFDCSLIVDSLPDGLYSDKMYQVEAKI